MKSRLASLLPGSLLLLLAGVFIALGLLVARDPIALRLWSTAPTQQVASGRVLADVGPPISTVVTSLSSARRSALRNSELINQIVNALPDRIRILVLVNDLDAFEIVRNPWPDRIEFIEVPSDVDLTTWPQDPFLVVDNAEEGKSLITSRAFSRARDIEMGGFVAAKMGWLHEHSQLSFEGGNLVSDEETSFIGGNTIRINAAELKLTEKEVARHFALLLGRRIVVIGPVPQPVGHIDMILTPLGGGKILLADPNWGAEIAERELLDSPRQVEDFELRAEEMFFGHPEIHELKQPDEQTIKRPELVGRTGEAVADSRELAGALDSIAQELVSQGFGVERVPYLSVRSSNPETNGVVGSRAAGPNYPVLTYNNVLIEEAGGEQHAYVPRYSLDALDREGHAVWRNLGYRVHPIDELTTSATYGGSLRCAVKVLAR